MKILWVVGEPCVGKSSLVAALLRGRDGRGVVRAGTIPYTYGTGGLVAPGDYTRAVPSEYVGRRAAKVAVDVATVGPDLVTAVVLDGPLFATREVVEALDGHQHVALLLEGSEEARERSRTSGRRVLPRARAAASSALALWLLSFRGRVGTLLADAPPSVLAAQVRAEYVDRG